jgi:predicted ester cyclase
MSIEDNKAIVRRFIEAINQQDEDAIAELVAPHLIDETKQGIQWVYATFAGHHIDITDMIGEGDQVWARLATSGGHTGELWGIPPTGKQWTNTGVYFVRVADGKIVAREGLFDAINHLEQLGATITPPASEAAS